jgi:alkyl hydroperoxide reductase subunit AhpC
MLTVGSPAPPFDCCAVVAGRLTRLTWRQIHDGRPLVLLFDALDGTALSPAHLDALSVALTRARPRARLAVVCAGGLAEALAWAERPPGAAAQSCPLLVDPLGRVALLYGLRGDDGRPLWAQVIIDRLGVVRQTTASGFPVCAGVEETLRGVRASAFPPDGLRN